MNRICVAALLVAAAALPSPEQGVIPGGDQGVIPVPSPERNANSSSRGNCASFIDDACTCKEASKSRTNAARPGLQRHREKYCAASCANGTAAVVPCGCCHHDHDSSNGGVRNDKGLGYMVFLAGVGLFCLAIASARWRRKKREAPIDAKDVKIVEPASSRSVIFKEDELSDVSYHQDDASYSKAELVYHEAFGLRVAEARPAPRGADNA
mmetsp:Transcript_9332/g.29096  ORF Transcript_9332/g.29096 Transcript_9332/m.29096 type:complete len:210 (-) Transcript_9332:89-718(-)